MQKCDVCLQETKYLIQLQSVHQTDQIKEICGECEKVLNKHKYELKVVTGNILIDWMRRFMVGKREAALKAEETNGI